MGLASVGAVDTVASAGTAATLMVVKPTAASLQLQAHRRRTSRYRPHTGRRNSLRLLLFPFVPIVIGATAISRWHAGRVLIGKIECNLAQPEYVNLLE